MSTRYMLMHKLHFVNVYVILSPMGNLLPKIYCGKGILQHLCIYSNQSLKEFDWHYWSRSNLHRYSDIEINILDDHSIQELNELNLNINLSTLDIENSIFAINFSSKNIIQLTSKDIDNKYYNEIAVIASFQHTNNLELLSKKAQIIIFNRNNQVKYIKQGICMYQYIDMCIEYKKSKNILEINKIIDKLNNNIYNSYQNIYKKTVYLSWLEQTNLVLGSHILNGKLTQSCLDYEGSTGIDFDILFKNKILPQQMVYFYDENNTPLLIDASNSKHKIHTPICTYTILEPAKSNKWTANGGIAHHLNQYINTKKLHISTKLNEFLLINNSLT